MNKDGMMNSDDMMNSDCMMNSDGDIRFQGTCVVVPHLWLHLLLLQLMDHLLSPGPSHSCLLLALSNQYITAY